MTPPSPFTSSRLSYRAIRPNQDLAVFEAINADSTGYTNSNYHNAKPPGPPEATRFLQACTESSLLGAIIWLRHDPSIPPASLPTHIARLQANEERKGVGSGGGTLIEPWGTAIGEIHFSSLPSKVPHHRHTEIGLDILPEWQGRGYGTEALEWALEHAFLRLGFHRVGIKAFAWNGGALRLYERVGFKVEGREREAFWSEGRWWDGVLMGMLEGEWRARRQAREGGSAGGAVDIGAEEEVGGEERIH
ncbi:hypothetical protein J1614_003415 [Plenodomus biglobosus]|nr:hypothetical protein J1614_003415 [Plenodomus biglobosus]